MIIYKSDCVTITYHEADKLIEATWHTYAASEEYRTALLQYVEALKQYEVRRWIGDYRKARVVRIADQDWTTREWGALFFPHCLKLEKMSRVRSTDVSARISFENMSQHLNLNQLPFVFQEFDSYDEAREWVLE